MVSINQLADIAAAAGGIRIRKKPVSGPEGVRGRNSDNTLIYNELKWHPQVSLEEGMKRTYDWIEQQVRLSLPATVSAPRAATR
jgi:nucleoside-diphosphate-sugar epimerase